MKYNLKIIKYLKYIIIFIILSLSCKYIPTNNLTTKEIISISMIGGIIYAILDMISPSIKIIKKNDCSFECKYN